MSAFRGAATKWKTRQGQQGHGEQRDKGSGDMENRGTRVVGTWKREGQGW